MQIALSVLEFVAKSLIVFVTFAACVTFFVTRMRARRSRDEPVVRFREIGQRWRDGARALRASLLPAAARKAEFKRLAKQRAAEPAPSRRVFVLDFRGDVLASHVEPLREEITALLGVAEPGDEVVLRLESSGGAVHGYGLAASQLARLRARKIPLTACIDKVAASGGYLMACVADRVLAAPFAIVGSIGVVAPVANVHNVLSRFGIEYEDVTAGKFKRPVSLFGSISEEGRAKLKEQVEETHALFKRFVVEMRPKLDIEGVATGEYWYGTRALELGLVDELGTSDDLLLARTENARVIEVVCDRPMSPRERVLNLARAAFGV